MPQSVMAEVGYLLTKAGGNREMASFSRVLPASKYVLTPLTSEDLLRTADLLDQYADTRLDLWMRRLWLLPSE